MAVPSGGRVSPIVCALEVVDADEVMAVTTAGKVVRISAESVPIQGRRTQGRRVLELGSGDKVVEVTRAEGPGGGGPAGDEVRADEVGADEDGEDSEGQLDLLG
jgi:DNA gyrase subunit A